MVSDFPSHLIALHGGVGSFLSAKIIIPVDYVDGEVTEWKDHPGNKTQSNLILIVTKTMYKTYITFRI